MSKLYTFYDFGKGEEMVPIGWILHLVGPWYLQLRLGRLSIERREKKA